MQDTTAKTMTVKDAIMAFVAAAATEMVAREEVVNALDDRKAASVKRTIAKMVTDEALVADAEGNVGFPAAAKERKSSIASGFGSLTRAKTLRLPKDAFPERPAKVVAEWDEDAGGILVRLPSEGEKGAKLHVENGRPNVNAHSAVTESGREIDEIKGRAEAVETVDGWLLKVARD